MRFLASAFAAAALAALAVPATAATITNDPVWDGSTFIVSFGAPDTTNYGQTFLSPGGNLNSLTFQLGTANAGDFRVAVAGFDGNGVTGADLWSSGDIAYTGAGAYSVNLDLATTLGDNYIAYLTIAGVANPITGAAVGGTSGDTIADGAFRFLNSNGAAPQPGQTWSSWYIPDMAFTASFGAAAVPEPATWGMMIAGFGLVGFATRRRRTMVAQA